MSNRTREINKITTTIISISVKLIVYALIVLLLYEAVARGYAFGHEIFYAEAVEEAPGRDVVVQMESGESVSAAAEFLARKGLIKSEFAFLFQSKFYDYDTIYPGTYTLNTSMTSKEILQLLNEKPETEADVKPAQSGKAKAATEAAQPAKAAAEDSAAPAAAGQAGAGRSADGQAEAPVQDSASGNTQPDTRAAGSESAESGSAASGAGEEAGAAGGFGDAGSDAAANEQTYEGEDQEMEGGWFEDVTEGQNP